MSRWNQQVCYDISRAVETSYLNETGTATSCLPVLRLCEQRSPLYNHQCVSGIQLTGNQ